MKTLTNIALALGAAGALALGSAAVAQDASKPEAKMETRASKEHRGEHREHGAKRMREMRGGCHDESRGERGHS